MIDKNYIKELNQFDVEFIQHEVEKESPNKTIQGLFHLIDCSRRSFKNNNRLIQTIDYAYRLYNGYILFILTNYEVIKEDTIREKWKTIHNNNIEYEKHFPNVIYTKKKPKPKSKKKTKDELNLEKENKLNINARESGLFKFEETK